jgi:hypothetical protein
MPFGQVVKMEPAYQKQNGHENLVLMPRVRSKVTRPNPLKILSPHIL